MSDHPDDQCPVNYPGCRPLAAVAALRTENERLAAQLDSDHLTGLFNHRRFRLGLETELERSTRTGQPVALIMVDLDHFKQVNDRWGHEVGNLALQHTARQMRATMRRIDLPCRYGGEEFAVIAPDTDLAGAVRAAERLRQRLEQTPVDTGAAPLPITASLGVAVHQASRPLTAEQLIREADAYLYEAKRNGRNRVGHPPLEPAAATQVSADERALLLG